MAPATRPGTINLEGLPQLNMGQSRSANGSGANSPIDAPAGSGSATGSRFPFANGRAGSPSKAFGGSLEGSSGSRLFPKRAREIQQQEGLSPQPWGPPTTGSGHSTPLRETIPESPGSDSFPDFDVGNLSTGSPGSLSASNSVRRSRAGTVPSRFPAMSSVGTTPTSAMPKSNRATPSPGLYQSGPPSSGDPQSANGTPLAQAALLSRMRAGSMPQRGLLNASSPFGNSLFASNWMAGRERASTLQSIRSSNEPSSPNASPADGDVRTLDYLGLVDTPQSGRERGLSRADMDMFMNQQRANGTGGVTIADLAALNAFNKNTANRFRSYSVNAKEKYADGPEEVLDEYEAMQQQLYSGTFTPNSETTAAQAAAINEAVRQHNLEVQAFANFASANRPRARTAGVLDSPSQRVLRNYMPTPSRLADSSMTAADLQSNDGSEFSGLATAVHNMNLNKKISYDNGLHPNLEAPTRSLWLGNIPSSTTVTSLNVIFSQFGQIEFARVLTHKSCGFVNFENVQSAMAAKAQCNGKEIFPGCGTIRIGFAKEQSASNTPGANGAYPSPSPDPFVSKHRIDSTHSGANNTAGGNINAETAAAALATPNLLELRDEIYGIVQQFGASPDDQERIAKSLENALRYDEYALEIPPIPEPSHSRVYDAPRLREIRKRIDNNSCGPMEIEQIALEMLPEVAELSSDYLGNTVVQKLFENCSEETKEAMLSEISPHLAEIGVHKNGTWAAQKVIDVARTSNQMHLIINALKPHAVNLFGDQYGNYVMQCCLRFQAPLNDFIFDSMLSKLWDIAQGRFGARAMRACLESHFATNDHKRLMAAAIALHSVQLATNSNGALLLTWFLDTCTFPQRRSVLAPRLSPHLTYLCTHKVAYLTVLKIINQRNEPEARDLILRALFFDEQTLTKIISDHTCGGTLIFKVLTTPFLDEAIRPECVENVRNVLLIIKAQPSQGYKRLMDEVGLSTRHGGTPISHDGRSSSKPRPVNGHLPHLDTNSNGYGRSPYGAPQHAQMGQAMTPDLQRSISMDSNGFDPYVQQYIHSPSMSNAGISPINPMQYQHAMLAQGQMARPPGFYGSPVGVTPSAGLPNGMGYGTASPGSQMMDPYRQMMGSMVPPGMGMQNGYQQQSYGNQMAGMNGYGQYQMPSQYYGPNHMQGQMASGNNRRGRAGPRY
ncbi:Pumilio domain-containing protein [Fulvia fulva]|nr:Pumilio domain-containing protein [Fulvia fulva]WPV15584.1 Pumilio domain-containing protein [Fulvia fulva]